MTFSGVYVPLVTPFEASGGVAFAALESLAHEVVDGGVSGLVALGTTAEPGSLSAAERRGVVEVVGGVCRERGVQLLVGANSVEAVAQVSEAAGVLTLVPPFVRPGEDGVVAYFGAVASAARVPVVVYHVPYRTGQPLSVGAVRRLAAVPGVAGVKWAVSGIDAVTVELMGDPPAGFAVLGGDDLFFPALRALGAHGGIVASAQVATADFVAGRDRSALSAALFAGPNPTVIKGVLHAQGRIPSAAVRLPLVPAAQSNVAAALHLVRGR